MTIKYSNPDDLVKHLTELDKNPILLVIPAISFGTQKLNSQYKDYLDQSANLYFRLIENKYAVKLFILGADHRGDGFLHQVGKNYLIKQRHIPANVMVWADGNYKNVGYCSVEEAELTAQFIAQSAVKFQVITCLCNSQFDRYQLHQTSYGIDSLYLTFPDKSSYYPQLNQKEEDILIRITQKDPRWETDIGQKLRAIAHQFRDPKFPPMTLDQIELIKKQMMSDASKFE